MRNAKGDGTVVISLMILDSFYLGFKESMLLAAAAVRDWLRRKLERRRPASFVLVVPAACLPPPQSRALSCLNLNKTLNLSFAGGE